MLYIRTYKQSFNTSCRIATCIAKVPSAMYKILKDLREGATILLLFSNIEKWIMILFLNVGFLDNYVVRI